MANLVGFKKVDINQAGGDESGNPGAVTCFGLPGYGGIRASMSSVHMSVYAAVYDDYNVYVGLNGEISDPVIAESYPVAIYFSSSDFHFSYSGGKLDAVGSNTKGSFSANIDAKDGSAANAPSWAAGRPAWSGSGVAGWFRWRFSCGNPPQTASGTPSGYTYVGKMQEFGASAQGKDGMLWIGGTGTYTVNDPLYPDPVPITIEGFMEFLDYFPFAIRKSGTMQSCNRPGGSVRIRKSNAWRDVKNVAVGSGNNKAFVRKSGQWQQAPKIGANAQ